MNKQKALQPLRTKNGKLFSFRLIGKVIALSGLLYICAAFLCLFIITASLLHFLFPEFYTFSDALWLCFESITTIGFGDLPTNEPMVRILLCILSIFGLFFVAMLTGVIVSYITHLIQNRIEESKLVLLDSLEHLDELSKEELKELSKRIRDQGNK